MTDGESWNKYLIPDAEFEIRYSVDGKKYMMAGKASARVITGFRYESYHDIHKILQTSSETRVELTLLPSESGVNFTIKAKDKEKVTRTVTVATADYTIGEVANAQQRANIPADATFHLNFAKNIGSSTTECSVTFAWDEEL